MTREIAIQISSLMLDIRERLIASLKFVEDRCDNEEFQRYRKAVGQVIQDIYLDIEIPIYTEYPDLKPKDLKYP